MRCCFEWAVGAVAGVVHQRIDAAEFCDSGVDSRPDGRDVLDVESGDERSFEQCQLGFMSGSAHGRDDIPALGLEVFRGGAA